MKQNEWNLILQDLWGSAKAISDMVSKPEILMDNYIEEYGFPRVDNAHLAYKDTKEGSPERADSKNPDWDRGTWYVAPDPELADAEFVDEYELVKRDIGICGMSFAFRPEPALNPGYVRELLPGGYLGFASATFCMHPKFFN